MEARLAANKLATTSLILGILGWIFYLLQWCFDLTIGIILTAATAGSGALCTSILDILPFGIWMGGILTGHTALRRIKLTLGRFGRRRAILGLVLSYIGMVFSILMIGIIIALIAAGIGTGVLERLIPLFHKH
jgi:hypothetical protein